MPTIPRIAIIGAGPASLTLANNLQYHSIPVSIYESSTALRSQGGTLDLHPRTGQLALKEAGLWGAFKKHARPEGDVMKLVALDGEILWDENGVDKHEVEEEHKFDGRPEIDRTALLHLLYDNLKSNQVHFRRKLKEVVPSGAYEAKYDLHFADGSKEPGFDLVVGGDDFLSTCGIDWTHKDTAGKEYVDRFFSHVSPDLKRVMLESKDGLIPQPLYELPVGFKWEHQRGVTLVGDAAHVFTPFAGEGVNTGMKDALVLAREIVKCSQGQKELDDSIKAYEEDMFPRAAKAAEKTMKGKMDHFSTDGGTKLANMFRKHYSEQQSETRAW